MYIGDVALLAAAEFDAERIDENEAREAHGRAYHDLGRDPAAGARKSGSQRTRWWRKKDSNHRYLSQRNGSRRNRRELLQKPAGCRTDARMLWRHPRVPHGLERAAYLPGGSCQPTIPSSL
jgi:hypothetical protein